MRPPKLTCVEDSLWIVEETTGLAAYDFTFEHFFACRHPAWLSGPVRAVARMGAAPDYAARFEALQVWDVELVHSPDEYARTSYLPQWYPLIEELTPRSHCFDIFPTAEEIERRFDYPLFLKGERQTNKHSRRQSIIESPEQLREVLAEWRRAPILSWQRVVCREFERLRPVAKDHGAAMPISFEFRSFWWKNRCVGVGPYWSTPRYRLEGVERRDALAVGREVAQRLAVTFLVVDLAQTVDGRWIVIECNDGQDAGYAGVDRRALWQHVIDGTEVTR